MIENINAIILAAGKGTRMLSDDEGRSKVSFPILGKPIIEYVLDALDKIGIRNKIAVVGFGGESAKKAINGRANIVWQNEIKGTADAALKTKELLKDKEGFTLVIAADTPLITSETLKDIIKIHKQDKNAVTVVTLMLENPSGYGRIIREPKSGRILAVKDEKDCVGIEKDIFEVNSGTYVFDNKLLFKYVEQIIDPNIEGEQSLSKIINLFVNNNLKVGAYIVENGKEMFSINNRNQLAYGAKIIRKRKNQALMLSGVSIEDPDTTYISPDVQIGKDTIVLTNTTILGNTIIGNRNIIGPNAHIENCKIGDENQLRECWILNSNIQDNNEAGPYTTIKDSSIKNHCKIGSFIEIDGQILEDNTNK